jgi:hypothetical protein
MVDVVVNLIAAVFLSTLVVTCTLIVYTTLVEVFPNAHLLCTVGLHRWDHRSSWRLGRYETWSRCRRDGCERADWNLVNVEQEATGGR